MSDGTSLCVCVCVCVCSASVLLLRALGIFKKPVVKSKLVSQACTCVYVCVCVCVCVTVHRPRRLAAETMRTIAQLQGLLSDLDKQERQVCVCVCACVCVRMFFLTLEC